VIDSLRWKEDWVKAKHNLSNWWQCEGMALSFYDTPRSVPIENLPKPQRPSTMQAYWTDPAYRCARAEYEMASRRYPAESIPYFDTEMGPGSLSTFLGAKPGFSEHTVWYNSCIDDPDSFGSFKFDLAGNQWWDVHMALIEEGLKRANGRYLVGIPDLIENLDTLAALRKEMDLLYDLCDRPGWVHARLTEITAIWIKVFDLMYAKVKDDEGGNVYSAFRIWGPGKTAKVQCDFSAMISQQMFREFVSPYLQEQCRHLDYAMYHLDGTNALQHLDALLEIDEIKAIEWTPQVSRPQGGSPEWYDLYRRIKAAGKAVQAIFAQPHEVVPLLDAIGPEGTFILLFDPVSEAEAEKLLKAIEPFHR
jgi:hypothetical protein